MKKRMLIQKSAIRINGKDYGVFGYRRGYEAMEYALPLDAKLEMQKKKGQ